MPRTPTATTTYYHVEKILPLRNQKSNQPRTRRLWPAQDPGKTPRLWTDTSWGLENLIIGHGLAIDAAREWGLFISSSRGKTSVGVLEPPLFSEPGLFLVRPDATLYASAVNTMPFARPNFGELMKALDFIIEKDYPARGEA